VSKFTDFPFSEALHKDLVAAGYETPTPIQAKAIRPVLEGKDVIGLAQTGTGKTAAFALPIIHRLAAKAELGALVLAPTRELVHQIVDVFKMLGASSGVRVASVVGGIKIDNDWRALRSWPNVLVATPGRLIDHLEQKTVNFKEIEMFVIDEADRMHDMGFIPQIRRIIAALPEKRQTLMFTATMPPDVEQIARRSMHDAVKILVGPASRPVERAEQHLYQIHDEKLKLPLLLDLLAKETGRVLVFLRTKRGVDRLARRIIDRRHAVARIHGDREMNQRTEAMKGFREGRYRVLIATDIAARGLDVADIEHVINYDFPRHPEDYVHRIGRTARLVATGKATSFVTPADRPYVRDLEKLIATKLTLEHAPGARHVEHEAEAAPATHDGSHRRAAHAATPRGSGDAAPAAAQPGEGAAGTSRRGRRGRRGRGRQGEASGQGRSQGRTPQSAPHGHSPHHAAGGNHDGRPAARAHGGEPAEAGHKAGAHSAWPRSAATHHGAGAAEHGASTPHASAPGQGRRRRRRGGSRGAPSAVLPAATGVPTYDPAAELAESRETQGPTRPPAPVPQEAILDFTAEDIQQKADPTMLEWD
jgi:ATP-dependent RNA helicase RhlE